MKTIFRMKLNVIYEEEISQVTYSGEKTFLHFQSGGNLRDIYCFPSLDSIIENLKNNTKFINELPQS